METTIPVQTLHLFPVLDTMLIELLKSLTPDEWDAQTVAKLWKVKDVAAHLLDGNLRALSISRDGYFGEKPENINSYQDLVGFLNNLNLTWTQATRRLSPQVLIELLELTGGQYSEYLTKLDPLADAVFSVAWAGQEVSPNWFHIAREYTEKFLHQQQIRDAVDKPGLFTRELYYPFIDTLMYALPHTFHDIEADTETTVAIEITGEIGGRWTTIKGLDGWTTINNLTSKPAALVKIDPDTAWKLFTKSKRPADVVNNVELEGNDRLALHALNMVSVMA